ncbi:MAG TPA: multiheme c-type cytochrome [Terriglobales bacterium]|nr:multiheme c-type cytochrome [Terriglobales bacterium]
MLVFLAALTPFLMAEQAKNVCVDCHAKLQGNLKVVVDQTAASVHGHKGMSCTTCHGGNAEDEARAKTPASGFRGHISRAQVTELCGACHADGAGIKAFNPSLRTDQLSLYHTSVHGAKRAQGDEHVAVCTDCHGAHDILAASDPRSPIHPTNVATTCRRCHSNSDLMKSYKLGATQFADYSDSVHHEAMMVRGDLSAPTCSTCHGSHGAVPPGAASVANVCSNCHVLQAQFFNESVHKEAFPEGCATCHSSHKIKHPDDNFVGLAKGAACAECHSAEDDPGRAAQAIHDHLARFETQISETRALMDRAAGAGMDVADAELELAQAKDSLTKARVRVHTASLPRVDAELSTGTTVALKARNTAEEALRERTRRRKQLIIPMTAFVAVMISLGAYIRDLERKERG